MSVNPIEVDVFYFGKVWFKYVLNKKCHFLLYESEKSWSSESQVWSPGLTIVSQKVIIQLPVIIHSYTFLPSNNTVKMWGYKLWNKWGCEEVWYLWPFLYSGHPMWGTNLEREREREREWEWVSLKWHVYL
jgi:hypothetical protein